jgi:hypothetical protein
MVCLSVSLLVARCIVWWVTTLTVSCLGALVDGARLLVVSGRQLVLQRLRLFARRS